MSTQHLQWLFLGRCAEPGNRGLSPYLLGMQGGGAWGGRGTWTAAPPVVWSKNVSLRRQGSLWSAYCVWNGPTVCTASLLCAEIA